jgi:AraC-like DNA-binding protein
MTVVQVQNTFVLNVEGLDDVIPAHGRIRAGYLRGFSSAVRKRGADPRRVLEHHNVDPTGFDGSDRDIDCSTFIELLEYSSRKLNDPLFGLHLAEEQEPDVFGCAMVLARAAPTLRLALRNLVEYVPVSTSPECEMELVTGRDAVELRWRSQPGLCETEQSHYQGLLLFTKTLRALGRQQFHPRYASLTFPIRHADMRVLEERLGCRVHGRAAVNAIAFSAEHLDCPIETSDRMLFNLLGSCLPQLRAASRSSFVEHLKAQVRKAIIAGNCCVDVCAASVGLSSRTLQKRLTQLGIKYSDIVQNERIRLAKHWLQWSNTSLDNIAFQLGYSEQTSFGRAFKRSTGLTPQAFRQANRPH